MSFSTVEQAIEDFRNGKFVLVADDEDRENEGDLICAAELITPEKVNFLLEAKGWICLALTPERCEELELGPMSRGNTEAMKTAFTVTIDASARFGVTTGISASDRATTIRVAVDPHTRPHDLRRPGHVNPLRARPGGVLQRVGHTEAAVDLARLGGPPPAARGVRREARHHVRHHRGPRRLPAEARAARAPRGRGAPAHRPR